MPLPVHDNSAGEPSACTACAGRREFLRDALGALVAMAGLSALAPLQEIEALTITGTGARAGLVRYPIPASDGVSIDKKHEVMICRSAGELFAFALSCPHQSTALRALPGTAGFQCPRHKSRYQPNGTFISGRATRNMDRLPITRDGDMLVVDVDVSYASDTEPAKWASAVVKA